MSTKINKVSSDMEPAKYQINAKGILRSFRHLFILCQLLLVSNLYGQDFPFILRDTWDGPYDIRMIGAPNMQAAYINASQASGSKLQVDSLIRYATMIMAGKNILEINNRYKEGSPFAQATIPLPALLCKDPNAACMNGVTLASPNSSCPIKYDDPATTTRYISMTYPDYDADISTYSSSMSKLDISSCAEIEAAYLYWTGAFRGSAPNITLVPATGFNTYTGNGAVFDVSKTSNFQTIKFKRPGGTYQNVTSTGANVRISSTRYLCVADVTTQLQGTGGGEFWAANIPSYPNEGDGGTSSGWGLVVVFRSPLSPPRLISLFDGLKAISSGSSEVFTLTGLQAPATTNFKSYVGFGALDGENLAGQLADAGTTPEGLGFQTSGGQAISLNPFKDDQPRYKLWNKKGVPAKSDGSPNTNTCKAPLFDANWASVYDGVSSSHITSYNEITNKNGNEIPRLPSNPNTLGFDLHHMKLPDNAVAPNSTTAKLTVEAGPQGGTSPFLAYLAIERLQPKLEMTKTADKNATDLDSEISYKLKIKNAGNDISLGGDNIYDTLDAATNFVPGSLTATTYVNGVGTVSPASVTLVSSANEQLHIKLNSKIKMNDSINIIFKVKVKSYASAQALWQIQCKRSITNTAWVVYNTVGSGVLKNKSNSNDCGIGSETRIVIVDDELTASSTKKVTVDASSFQADKVMPHILKVLTDQGVATGDISKFDLRDALYNRIRPETDFPAGSGDAVYKAIRDYNNAGTCQEIYEITFKFCAAPVAPAATPVTPICSGASKTLTASGTSIGTFFWYNSATGGTPQTNPYTVTSLNATTTYYLIDSVLTTKCKSLRTAVVVTVNPTPADPVAPVITPICAGNTTSLNKAGTATGTFFWLTSSTGGTANANPYTTTVLNGNTTYYLIDSSTTSKCKSARIAVPVTVNPVPATPVAPASPSICPGNFTILNKNDVAATGTYFWYTKATGGTPNANAYTTPILNASTTYYLIDSVSATQCKSARTAVVVNISPVPAKPTAPAVAGICPNNSTTLNKNDVPSTGTYFWYTKATGGVPNANPFTTPALSTNTTYYLIDSVASAGGCKSARTAVNVIMNQVPGTPGYTATPICAGSTTTLNKTGTSTGTFFWYTSSTGGTPNTNPLTTPALLTNTTYYLIDSSTTTGCKSPRTAVIVQVNPVPANPVAPVIPGICSGSTAIFNITGTPTGKYFWYTRATGGVPNANPFTSATLTASTTYYLIDSVPSGCKSQRTPVTVNVDPAINPGVIGTSSSLCASTGFTLTGTLPAGGSSTYTYSWLTDNGGGFTPIANTNTQDYTSGGLTVTTKFKRIVSSGTCTPVEGNVVTVTILPGLDPGAIGSDATICYNGNANLTSSAAPSGGNGTFSLQWESSLNGVDWNPVASATSATYSASNLTATVKYRRTVTSGTGSCSVASTTPVTITVHPDFTSAGTIATDKATICSGDAVNISGTALPVGGTGNYTYAWTISPATTIPANTSADFLNLTLTSTAKTLYTLTRTATSGTCGSLSTTVDVTVNPKVAFTVTLAPIADICSTDPNPVIFTATPSPTSIGTGGVYEWYVDNVLEGSTTNTLNKLPSSLVDGQGVYVNLKPGADACPSKPFFASNTLTLKVASKVIPTVGLNNTVPACAGVPDTLIATANSAGSAPVYEWTINGGPNPEITNRLIYVPTDGDVVTVTVISNSNCKSSVPGEDRASKSLTLSVKPLVTPSITINADNITPCAGDMVKFDTTATSNRGTFPTYKWYSTNTGVQANATGVSFSTNKLTGTDQVWIEMTSNAECIVTGATVAKSNLITVTVTPKVTPRTSIFANPGGTICAGESVTFNIANTPADTANGGGGVTYEWKLNSIGSVLGTGPTFTTNTLANNDVVEVRYISSLRCLIKPDDTKSITMKVRNPTVSFDALPFCDNDRSGVLTAQDQDGTDPVTGTGPTFKWTTTGTLSGSGTGPVYTKTDIMDQDVITVTMIPGYTCNGPSITHSETVTVYTKPVIDLTVDDSLICPTDQAIFKVTGGPAPTYAWRIGNVNLNNNTDEQRATVAGNYTVRVTNVLPNCFTEKSKVLQVENVVVDAGPDRSMFKGEFAILLASTNGKYDVTWTPQESVSDNKTLIPIVTPNETTIYTISVVSDNGCPSEDKVLVQVFIPVEVPNAFTPNGDGLNEGWVIKGLEKYPNTKVKIFNRWGGIIHEDKDGYKYPWDGTNNGQPMPTGTYYYVIDLIGSPDNTDKSMTGHLTIIR